MRRTAGAASGQAAHPIEPGGVALTDDQRLAWLRLFRCENVGPVAIMAQTPESRQCRQSWPLFVLTGG